MTHQQCAPPAYGLAEDWATLPENWTIGDVGGVGIDRAGRVYVFNRSPHPILVFEDDGAFVTSWGEDTFTRPHGLFMGPDETIYLTDDGDHTMRRCALDGAVLLEIGDVGRPAGYMSGAPFNRCTHSALSPAGDIYISDGYGNARVHKYSPGGTHLLSWGSPGAEEGEFNIVHNLVCDREGFVYVADRENHRIQVFDEDGAYVTQWNNLHRPCALALVDGDDPVFIVGEVGPGLAVNRRSPNLGLRVLALDRKGTRIASVGSGVAGHGPLDFLCPHGIAVDPDGDIYVGEVANAAWPHLFPNDEVPPNLRTFRKLVPDFGRGILGLRTSEPPCA